MLSRQFEKPKCIFVLDRKPGLIPVRRDGEVAIIPLADVVKEQRKVPRELYELAQVFG